MPLLACWLLLFAPGVTSAEFRATQRLRRSKAGFVTARLSRRFKVQRDQALHRYGAPVHGIRLEMPLPHRIDGGPREHERPLHELYLLDGAIAADHYLQNHAAALPGGFRRGWIHGINRLIQQVARRGLREIARLNR